MKRTAATIWCFFLTSISFSQDLSGFWQGSFNMRGCFPQNNIELQITMAKGAATGDSYHFLNIENYVKKKFEGSYNAESKKLVLHEGMITTYHIPQRCVICIKTFDLSYSREGNVETLSGMWSGNVLNSATDCGGGTILLRRTRESSFKDIPEIKVDTGTIKLDFYDNAEIDGDSITVKVNDRIVFSHQRLTAKPLTTYIKIDPYNTFYEVELIAENLGTIPPNTAVLIITAGEKLHRLSLSSSQAKSAKVRFIYEGPVRKSVAVSTTGIRSSGYD